ncbi:MAG: hypothetical protein Q4G35_13955, partial [Propionibacteriaceae bacterium]|nr:hypothetical protein [Propionibacteriaceae bacterium]
MKQYVTLTQQLLELESTRRADAIADRFGLSGFEVFMDWVRPRNERLFEDEDDFGSLQRSLSRRRVRRIHCSYWGYPTAFLTKQGFSELVERAGGVAEVRAYYKDTTGEHMFARWRDEYQLACALKADAYVFHAIDYAMVDGAWDFTLSRTTIRDAMIAMVQQLLEVLDDASLVSATSPIIEVENAGWGLEYGLQTADDFAHLLAALHDPQDRIRVGWDVNHLLHAVGSEQGQAAFHLTADELTEHEIPAHFPNWALLQPPELASAWIRRHLMDPRLRGRVSTIHLSDCKPKSEPYFLNGRAQGTAGATLDTLPRDERGKYGLDLVLTHYDAHLPLGDGLLDPPQVRQLILDVA